MTRLLRPPGPENHGIVGNFPLRDPDPLSVYVRWAREYGDVFYYRNLHWHVYFLTHPDLIRELLVTKYRNFLKGQAVQFSRPVFGNGLVTNEGESWAQQRKLIQPTFHKERIDAYGEAVVDHTLRVLDTWAEGERRDVHRDMMQLALRVVSKALFGLEDENMIQTLSGALSTTLQLTAGARMLLPPVLRRIPTPDNLRYTRAVRQLDKIVYGLIRERKGDPSQRRDLLSLLQQVRGDDGRPMQEQQLRDEVTTLLLAGHETTATALTWSFTLLSKHPEVEEKMWAEVDGVLGGAPPNVHDVPRLPYTEAVIKEAMRLLPPVWALVRTAIDDCEIGGYTVPAGATVLVSQWVTHRDPRFWADPERFEPERWLRPEARAVPNFAYFPFGGGPRVCIGASFAMTEAVLVLACVAQRFRLRQDPGCGVRPIPTITLRPDRPVLMYVNGRARALAA